MSKIHKGFLIIHNFLSLKLENKFDIVISDFNFNTEHLYKCKSAVTIIQLACFSYIFALQLYKMRTL